MDSVIEIHGLRKTYGPVVAVDEVSFNVQAGEIFGIVGPNGAGKTTTVECIEGHRTPDGGHVKVLGLDPIRDSRRLKQRIGIQLQEANLPDRLRVWESLDLFASFYERAVDWSELLSRVGLTEKRNAPFGKLSGGQKQRLLIALALISDPELVLLDELTTGLDPQARHAMWQLIRDIRARGKTIVLTTHYMEEAERLCDRVLIMDRGAIIALDKPGELIRHSNADTRVVFELEDSLNESSFAFATRIERQGNQISIYGRGEEFAGEVLRCLGAEGYSVRNLRTEHPNLETVFLALTGREMPT